MSSLSIAKPAEVSEKPTSVHVTHVEQLEQLDAAAGFTLDRTITHEEGLRVRKKIDRVLLPMMCTLYAVQFMDKTTLGSAAILGIRTDTHLTANDNWLGTIFYVSYFIFQYPQNLALQRLPIGKWMSLNAFVWAIALTAHVACKNFQGLFVVRFILGMCEGSVTTGFLLVTAMFYTRAEQNKRIGYWFLMDGTSHVLSGFLSFGVLHIRNTSIHPWKWLMIIMGLVTFILSIVIWAFFPDSPTTAWFLSPEERRIAIERIKVNQTGIGNKRFKYDQLVECLKDPKTWLFALFSCLINIPNSLTNQKQIITRSFGFNTLQTTLLSCVDGLTSVISTGLAIILVAKFKNSRAWTAIGFFIPNVLGSILVNTLPWSDKIGLLLSLYVGGLGTSSFFLSLSWLTAVTAGHTKRITTNAIMLSAFCIGNIVGPQMWQAQYAPRNRVPWIVITICGCVCPVLLYIIRVRLANENKRRDAEAEAANEEGGDEAVFILETLPDGTTKEVQVDKAFLDLTDIQNRDFRYIL